VVWGLVVALCSSILPMVFIVHGARQGRWDGHHLRDRERRVGAAAGVPGAARARAGGVAGRRGSGGRAGVRLGDVGHPDRVCRGHPMVEDFTALCRRGRCRCHDGIAIRAVVAGRDPGAGGGGVVPGRDVRSHRRAGRGRRADRAVGRWCGVRAGPPTIAVRNTSRITGGTGRPAGRSRRVVDRCCA
jgi:hypothetical protein